MKRNKTKILIVEESDVIRAGLSYILKSKNTSYLVEECEETKHIQHYIRKTTPDIVIVNPSVFEENEKQFVKLKEKHQTLCVGLIYTFCPPDKLKKFDALIYFTDKDVRIQNTIKSILKTQQSNSLSSSDTSLTKREKQVLKLLVDGNTTKQIADTLFISAHTVNAHRKNIMKKLDIKTVSGLTIYAVLNNIVNLDEVF